MTSWAKNARINASGYSPAQWVLGCSMSMPWSLLDHAGKLAEQSRAVHEPQYAKRLGMLTAARRAFEHLDTSQRLRRAWLARSRLTPSSQHLLPGTTVYIYRKVKPRKGTKLPLVKAEWHGPATVVCSSGAGETGCSLSDGQAIMTLHLHHVTGAVLNEIALKKGTCDRSVAEFEERYQAGIEEVFDYSFRWEYQGRGTIHVQMVLSGRIWLPARLHSSRHSLWHREGWRRSTG